LSDFKSRFYSVIASEAWQFRHCVIASKAWQSHHCVIASKAWQSHKKMYYSSMKITALSSIVCSDINQIALKKNNLKNNLLEDYKIMI
jgi:hypothetical protein